MTIHRVKLKDIDSKYIQQLQEEYNGTAVEIEIHLPESATTESKVNMNEEVFWQIINLLDWERAGNDNAVLEPAIKFLSSLDESAILTFYDLLSEKLYLLDGQEYADHSSNTQPVSSDLFLYGRCCVVANGRATFEKVLADPTTFPKDLFFEALLYLPEKAWFRKTGKKLEHIPKYIYETGFNPNGWGAKTISL